jgi:hypothetical protein
MTDRAVCIGLRQKPFRPFSATHIDVDAAANSWNSSQVDRRSWKSQKQANAAEASSLLSCEMNFLQLRHLPSPPLPSRPYREAPRAAHSCSYAPQHRHVETVQ